MISVWAPLLLTSATGGLLALPLAPAITELIRRKDADPLPTRDDDGNIDNFANAFRRYLAPLIPQLADCTERNCIESAQLRDGQSTLLVGVAGYCGEIEPELQTVAMFSRAVWLRDEQVCARDLYAADLLHAGKNNIFRAVLGEKDIFLGEGNQVLRWLRAEGRVIAAADAVLAGRLSAGESICLSQGCCFERVHAPAIFAVLKTDVPSTPEPLQPHDNDDQRPRNLIQKLGRSRIHGDLHLRVGEMFLGNIIATGSIQVEEETQIMGSAKAHADIRLRDRAQIKGAVVSTASIRTGSNCYMQGPVLAEREIHLGVGTRVGTPESPTTVSAPRIHLMPGCVIHGTVWAKVEGRVGG